MLVYYWLVVIFMVGAIVGSFLNVVIARLPLEKSILWPGSRCNHCLKAIAWYDNIPLASYWWLRGRCRNCGHAFSIRYFVVELVSALGFVGLFYAEMIRNVHAWPGGWAAPHGFYPFSWWAGYFYHAILFALLLAAAVCDLDCREIPLGITIPGTIVGLVGAVLMPWPWPYAPAQAIPAPPFGINPGFAWMAGNIKQGIMPWPVWGPLPGFLAPGGNWQTGLATGLAGILVGSFLLRTIGFVFSKGLGKESLGLGDADLMMMAGAFLGWQPVVVAFFVSVVPGLVVGVFQRLIYKDNSLPFGPSLAVGLMTTLLCWQWLGTYVQPLFFWGEVLAGLAAVLCLVMFLAAVALRLLRR